VRVAKKIALLLLRIGALYALKRICSWLLDNLL
jgi:hypothetical protein